MFYVLVSASIKVSYIKEFVVLTQNTLRKVLRLEHTLGFSLGGSCFGVSDASRLRPPTFVPMRQKAILQEVKKLAPKIGQSKNTPKKGNRVAKITPKKKI